MSWRALSHAVMMVLWFVIFVAHFGTALIDHGVVDVVWASFAVLFLAGHILWFVNQREAPQ